jgi:hypothetical protein
MHCSDKTYFYCSNRHWYSHGCIGIVMGAVARSIVATDIVDVIYACCYYFS